MTRKPVDSAAAVAAGLDHLLRKRGTPDTKPVGGGSLPDDSTNPIEPTFLVAAADARDSIRQVADYVCDGTDDEEEINAALAAAGVFAFGAKVLLSEGQFNVTSMVTNNSESGLWLAGSGVHGTRISMQDNSYTDAYVVDMNNISQISDFQVYVVSTATGLTAAVRLDGMMERVDVEMFNNETFDALVLLENNVAYVSDCTLFYSSTTFPSTVVGIKATATGTSETKLFNNHITKVVTGIEAVSDSVLILGNSVRDCVTGIDVTGDSVRVVTNHALLTNPSFGPTGSLKAVNVNGADGTLIVGNLVTGTVPGGSTLTGLYLTGSIGNVTNRANHWDAGTPVDDQSTTLTLIEDLVSQPWADSKSTLVTVTGLQPFIWSGAGTVVDARAVVNTAPTGAALVVNVLVNAASLWSVVGLQPTIAISAKDSGLTIPDQNATLADGDVLTVDIDQVGSTIAGGNLTVVVRIRERF